MQLGVYVGPGKGEHEDALERIALYDFENKEWSEDTEGYVVKNVSPDPSPEEFVVRLEHHSTHHRVLTPKEAQETEFPVVVNRNPTFTLEEGKEFRAEHGWIPSRIEMERREERGIIVVPEGSDNFDELDEEDVVLQSDYDGYPYADHFDFDFDSEE